MVCGVDVGLRDVPGVWCGSVVFGVCGVEAGRAAVGSAGWVWMQGV